MVPRTVTCVRSIAVSFAKRFDAHHGHEIDAEGDAFFIGFKRATDAVAAAVTLSARSVPQTGCGCEWAYIPPSRIFIQTAMSALSQPRGKICAAAHGGQSCCRRRQPASSKTTTTRRPVARPRRSSSEGHLPTPAAVPDRGRWSPARVSAARHRDRRRDDRNTRCPLTSPAGAVMDELGDDGAAAAAAEYHRIVVEAARANDGVELEGAADWSLCAFSRPRAARSRRDPGGTSRQRLDPDRETRTPRGVHTGRVTRLVAGPTRIASTCQAMRVGRARAGTCLTLHARAARGRTPRRAWTARSRGAGAGR